MLRKHLDGLLAYFRHWITNAATEGLNSKIQAIKAARQRISKLRQNSVLLRPAGHATTNGPLKPAKNQKMDTFWLTTTDIQNRDGLRCC
jgi:hypothetical protein